MPQNSFELLRALKNIGYLKTERDPLWWPQSGTERVLFGALLTQQAKWENVEKSLTNLSNAGIDTIQAIANSDISTIIPLIQPSGFYNTKARRLQTLCQNIVNDFGTFEAFKNSVEREWLLNQKGIGKESADSILCYGCLRDAFVVDSYTARLLEALGYSFGEYESIQEWIVTGLDENRDRVRELYDEEIPLHKLYARLHGKIVEFSKDHIRGKRVDTGTLLSSLEYPTSL